MAPGGCCNDMGGPLGMGGNQRIGLTAWVALRALTEVRPSRIGSQEVPGCAQHGPLGVGKLAAGWADYSLARLSLAQTSLTTAAPTVLVWILKQEYFCLSSF